MRRASLCAVVITLLFAGCSKAPVVEMQNCEAALRAAKEAEAPEYAPEAFKAASDSVNAAMAAMKEQDAKFGPFRSYARATQMIASAQAAADRAKAAALAQKTQLQAAVTTMMAETQALVDSASAVLARAPRGKGSKADLDLITADLASLAPALEQVKTDFDGGKLNAAKAGLDVVQNKARSILEEIETALSKRP